MQNRYRVKDLLQNITQELDGSIERAAREAQLLVMAYLDVDELWLITHQNTQLDTDIQQLFEWVARRKKQEPFEYIVN